MLHNYIPKINLINQDMMLSTNRKNKENISTITNTIAVVIRVSFLVGHTIFCPSCFTSLKNLLGLKSFIIVETL